MHLSTNLDSAGLVIIGTIAGGIPLNIIILGAISGAGVLLQTYATAKKYDKKVESTRFAYASYFNILSELRNNLRRGIFDESIFFNKCSIIDNIIIDNCPTISDKIMKKYDKKFIVQSTNKVYSNISHNHAKSFGFSDFNFKINPPFKKQTMNNLFNRNNSFTLFINLWQYIFLSYQTFSKHY